MKEQLLIVGGILLIAGIFGYTYSENQQGILQQGEDAVIGESQDWDLIQSLSAASIIGGLIIVVAGLLSESGHSTERERTER